MDDKPDRPLPPLPPLQINPISEEEEIRRRRLAEEAARRIGWRFAGSQLTTPKGKLLVRRVAITSGTMLLALIAAGYFYGWAFGTGLIALIFIHECGHVWAARRLGLPVGDMVFIPFVGAFVTLEHHDDPAESAYVAIMGPVFQAVGALLCLVLAYALHSVFFWNLAAFNFGLIFFNLIPIPPLDGSRIGPALFNQRLPLPDSIRQRLGTVYFGLAILSVAIYWLPRLN